ncbi:MAG: SDR family NAD(P)-dependent oxidoreductase, partial [Caldilineaceae bacterium]|nr:SDR family NAD(P)-dependent oxidoreductase [Caldilineaceae bacterium]
GKIALITGAGRGMGQAVAQTLAAEGAIVFVNDVNEAHAAAAVAAIQQTGGQAFPAVADISQWNAVWPMV